VGEPVGAVVQPRAPTLELITAMLPPIPPARERATPGQVPATCHPSPMSLPPLASPLHPVAPPFHPLAPALHPPGMVAPWPTVLETLVPRLVERVRAVGLRRGGRRGQQPGRNKREQPNPAAHVGILPRLLAARLETSVTGG
jgi:hypothetical protein